jgi:tetratricopeptide (TPR) repeat protein
MCASAISISCGGGTAASQVARPPEYNPAGQTKCGVAKSQARPLIVEWPAADRAALESQAKRGLVVVRYQGCELEVLRQCKADGDYAYVSLTPKQEGVVIRDEDELYANIPVHAAKFEGQLKRAGQLNVNMTIVGMYEARAAGGVNAKLEGDCKGATHLVTALTVGSFEFFAGADANAGAGASVLGAGAGAKSSAHREILSRDGDSESCAQAKRGDTEPPPSCGALLRLEVLPLDASLLPTGVASASAVSSQGPAVAAPPAAASKQCPAGQTWQGDACRPAGSKPMQLAPEDESFVDTRGGFEWGNRCFKHLKARRLANARAACQKALDMSPEPQVLGAVLYNFGLVEEADGDIQAACSYLRRSLEARDNDAVRRKYDTLQCSGAGTTSR